MKRKLLLSLLTMASAALTLTGCGEPDHVHTWATTWSTSSTQHWVIATYHPEVCSYLGNHTDGNNDGYCDTCGYKMSGVTPTPPSPDVEAYYAGINPDSSTLLNDLRTLNSAHRNLRFTYKKMQNILVKSDVDPNGSGKVVGFYDNSLVGPTWDSGDTWNKEHVWPNSLGGNLVENDAHMPRPSKVSSNSDRGNDFYAESGAYDPGSLGIKNYRGISARIIFYCCVASSSLSLVDKTSGGGNQMGKLSDLLKWNLEYLPSTSETAALELRVEQQRNNVIAKSENQGNRNPFIDHPEYACKIWGTTNSETRRICGM